ncbi:Exopolysaccharide biosynthesis protein related to N-acetylglucosamine-1-phosphodiester alpha-N-acetylglucosaminidase [Weeksella virosa]|uniref:phosphodiester glycosidase family protein n=1 Tax=Weeksella virosa TaxID=1014 RepID=UPI000E074F95|nr:phosphodiester glycosidase family protein [Weeksella virosa]SUP54977.1 Exopolysaccharide biosynthesis protein related to N-acetylglucosamine-1-phosphodiester alpha-N-acetylglucosaminidase [Weeksella virosa]
MKKLLLALIVISFIQSCASVQSIEKTDNLLLDRKGWKINEIEDGITHYEFPSQYYHAFKSYQNVNVLAIHPQHNKYKIDFTEINPRDSISAVGNKNEKAIFAINGTYYEKNANAGNSTSYFKTKNQLIDSVQVKPGTLYYWKHEGAFYMTNEKVGIVRGNNKTYNDLNAANIMSGSPLLIENYHPSGLHFTRNIVENLNDLNYENPDRHQGVRHPRTAVAIMPNNVVLFIAVDGRNDKAAGMSAKELTEFLITYFNPKDALNIDGGGSTTFWLRNDKRSKTGVINYPTDNKKFDHNGQRRVRNGFMIVE